MRAGLRRLLHANAAWAVAPALWMEWGDVQRWLLVLAVIAGAVEVVRLTVPAVRDVFHRVLPVWRPHEHQRLSGAFWLAVGFAVAARAPIGPALGGILAAAWADPAAAAVGARFGGGRTKSAVGSGAVLVVTTLCVVAVGAPLSVALVAGVVGAMWERWATAPDDNLWLAPGVTIVLVAFA